MPFRLVFATLLATLLAAAAATRAAAEWTPVGEPAAVAPRWFEAPEGLEVTVWASTPMLFNPTNMDIDARGRIWVAEGVNYRGHAGRRPQGDRIVVLEDRDGDGRADHSQTFVQEEALVAPLGVAVFDNVVVVSQPPDLIVYTDVDRDLRFDPAVDKREVLLTGFNARNHDHGLHSVTGGPDGKWYFNNGNCGAVFTDRSGRTFRMASSYHQSGGGEWFVDHRREMGRKSDDGFAWTAGFSVRMNPDGSDVEIVGHGYRNSYEQCLNSLGEMFQNDNDDPSACRTSYVLEHGSAGFFTRGGHHFRGAMREDLDYADNHWRQADPGTFDVGDVYGGGSPTGIVFYENGALGPEMPGTLLSCEAARNEVFAYQPEARGAGYQLDRRTWLTTNPSGEVVGSDFVGGGQATDEARRFRPSDIAVGADGAIYISDWFDPRVGAHADLDGSCSGTIYRIAPPGFRPDNPDTDLATPDGAMAALRSPAVNVRWTGFEALRKRGASALPAVLDLLDDPDPWVAARGIWLLPHLGEEGVTRCRALLESDDPQRRLAAFRALKRVDMGVLRMATRLARDPDPALRREAALAMRGLPAERSAAVLVEVARRWDGEDKNALEAIGLGAENHESEVWRALRESLAPEDALAWDERFARLTWRLWPAAAIPALKTRAESTGLDAAARELAVESIAFIDDPAAVDALFDIAASDSPTKPAAIDWLIRRAATDWRKFDLTERLKRSGIYDPESIQLSEAIVPPQPDTTKFTEAEVLALEGDAGRGKDLALRCVMCHRLDGLGPHYGPDLRGWVDRQGSAMAVRAIVNPSAGIAHGYEGTAIQLKDERWIDGLVRSSGDPLVVTSSGGLTQKVPRQRIKDTKRMDRSLMLNADQLGLSAQDVADIVAWLESY